METKHYELNYCVSQFLSGFGCFRKYLHRFGRGSSPTNCVDEKKDTEHILACCHKFSSLIMEEENSRILCSQYSQRMAEVMLEFRRLEERRRNLN